MMTIGDYPDYLALGYLLNQNMLKPDDVVTGVEYDEELAVVVVRTERRDQFRGQAEEAHADQRLRAGHRLRRPHGGARRASRCRRRRCKTSWLYRLTHAINTTPSLYLEAGAIHGCVLCARGPAARLHGGCRPPQRGRQDRRLDVPPRRERRRQDLLHDRPADLGDGDQDRAHGHPDPGLALRLHRLGRRAGAQAGPDPDRPRPRQALPRARRARSASSSTRTSPTSRRRAPSTAARARGRCGRARVDALAIAAAECHPRRAARRRAGAAHGRRRQAAADARRPHHPGARDRAARAAMRRAGPQRQRRSGALRRLRPAGGCRRRAGLRRAARRHPRGARLGGRATGPSSHGWRAPRPTRRSCRAISWRGCTLRGRPPACRSPAPSRAGRRIR